MQLIWVSGPIGQVQTYSITARKVIWLVGGLATVLVLIGFALHWVGLRVAIEMHPSLAQSMGGVTTASEQMRLEAGYREKLDALNAQYKTLWVHVQKLEADKNEIAALNKIESLRKPISVEDVSAMDGKGGPFKAVSWDRFRRIPLGEGMDTASRSAQDMGLTFNALHQQWRQEIDWLKTLPIGLPVSAPARLSSTFGIRLDPLTHRPSHHEGLDFVAPVGAPVVATAPGVVTRSEWSGAYGNWVEVAHAQGFHSRYAHLSQRKVAEGDRIERGTEIGALGNTGRSTGPHLHYEIMFKEEVINPTRVLAALRK